MKTLRNALASAVLLLPAAVSLTALPGTAWAQREQLPEVRSLEAGADGPLEPGTRLSFRLDGTPRSDANVRLRGVREPIPLREVAWGVYEGSYTLRRGEQVDRGADVRATLRSGDRTAQANFDLGEILPRPRVQQPPARIADPRIERFGILPLERIEPGADIRFALEGTPGAVVLVDFPGVATNLGLREVRPGSYEGSYTLRRADNFNPNRPIVATLRLGDRVTTANAALPTPRVAVDNQPPVLADISPREGSVVPAGPPVQIGARFDDGRGSGVDPASVQINVSGRNVTRESQINRDAFSFRGVLPPGRHTVDVTARDAAGNLMRRNWSFDVGAQPVAVFPAPNANVPIQLLNQTPNGQIGPGPTLVQGRTGPNALVAVTVMGTASLAGGMATVSVTLYSQTLQADANGNFAFTFLPQDERPEARYDVTIVSTRANSRQESKFSLYQR